MPKIPSRDPILLIHIRLVSAHGIVIPSMWWGIVDKCQDLSMLRRL
jgi:hypothetical protein